jgi:hypothetical protein
LKEKTMQAAKEGKGGKIPLAGHTRQKNKDPEEKRRATRPVEGAQTGSQGLGYLKDTDKAAGKSGRPKRGR